MAGIKGRQPRTGVASSHFLGVRLCEGNFAKLDRMADALGLSKAAVVDMWLEEVELDARGRPAGWKIPVPKDQEELPLGRTA